MANFKKILTNIYMLYPSEKIFFHSSLTKEEIKGTIRELLSANYSGEILKDYFKIQEKKDWMRRYQERLIIEGTLCETNNGSDINVVIRAGISNDINIFCNFLFWLFAIIAVPFCIYEGMISDRGAFVGAVVVIGSYFVLKIRYIREKIKSKSMLKTLFSI